jgi:bacterial/archaeal transporter family-2 protein
LRYAVILAVLVGVAVAIQTSFTSSAQRTLGPALVASFSGFTTGFVALVVSLFASRPELSGGVVGYTVVSGFLGTFIVSGIAFAAGHSGLARTLSLVVASQLLVGLLLDALGILGAGAQLSLPKALGVLLILIGGVLVIRY